MKFDYSIGNPPYQESKNNMSGNKEFAAPIYNYFIDEANKIASKVELIHPARFLFDAGSTPKSWNQKMLSDHHFKVLEYYEDATEVFPNTDIKGGVTISYHDTERDFGAIKVFLKMKELRHILNKVVDDTNFQGMNQIVISRTAYRLTSKMHQEHPEAKYKKGPNGENIGCLSEGHDFDMSTNIFDRLPQIFFNQRPNDDHKYIKIIGRSGNDRVTKWVRQDYVNDPKPLFKYSIILPKANNTGKFGEVLSSPTITNPGTGSTETFLSVGFFDTKDEVDNCLKFIKTKFSRAMLGILKTTQDLTPEKWKYVPLQDFTSNSDIDWSKSVKEIDEQLYRKYNLDPSEIEFIESHVKEMI